MIKTKAIKEQKTDKEQKIWLILLKNTVPAILLMSFVGLYGLFDEIFTINFGMDQTAIVKTALGVEYQPQQIIRMAMALSLIVAVILEAFALMFSIGSSVIYSRLLANGELDKAKKFIRTSFKVSFIASIALVPMMLALIFPIFNFAYDGDVFIKQKVFEMANTYIEIIIIATPFLIFNQYMSSLLRAQGKIYVALMVMFVPLLLNIFMDWTFMHLLHMGIKGGAWSTFVAYTISALMILTVVAIQKNEDLGARNLISFKDLQMKMIVLAIFIGIAPLLRNVSQSFTDTIEMHKIHYIGGKVYSFDDNFMYSMFVGALPIFNVFFPILFGFIHGGAPVISKMYASKNKKTMVSVYRQLLLQSFIIGVVIAAIAYGLSNSFYDLLKTTNILHRLKDRSRIVFDIMILSIPLFGMLISSITYFTGIGNFRLAILASTLRGFVLIWPFIKIFTDQALGVQTTTIRQVKISTHPPLNIFQSEFIFWWYFPVVTVTSSIFTYGIVKIHQILDHNFLDPSTPKYNRTNKIKVFYKVRRWYEEVTTKKTIR